jgi:cell shape-determining protein MreC
LRFVPAAVTGLITTDESMLLTINRGRADGVGARDPVVALKGLVGLVRSVQEHSAQVQAITDPMSVVGAATATPRARALYGRGRGKPSNFFPKTRSRISNIGSELITRALRKFELPKGITIGTIKKRDLNFTASRRRRRIRRRFRRHRGSSRHRPQRSGQRRHSAGGSLARSASSCPTATFLMTPRAPWCETAP